MQTCQRSNLSFGNKKSFFQKIDTLPQGPQWQCEIFEAKGDELDEEGNLRVEYLELWKRNPVECIQELISNPIFCSNMCYTPEAIFEDMQGTKVLINEMWTAEWWRDFQVHFKLARRVMYYPLIIFLANLENPTFRSHDRSGNPCF